MEIIHNFTNFEATEAIKNVANEKSQKFEKFFKKDLRVVWTFSLENHEHKAHCHLHGGKETVDAEAVSDLLYKSIDLCVEKVVKQIARHKAQLHHHQH